MRYTLILLWSTDVRWVHISRGGFDGLDSSHSASIGQKKCLQRNLYHAMGRALVHSRDPSVRRSPGGRKKVRILGLGNPLTEGGRRGFEGGGCDPMTMMDEMVVRRGGAVGDGGRVGLVMGELRRG